MLGTPDIGIFDMATRTGIPLNGSRNNSVFAPDNGGTVNSVFAPLEEHLSKYNRFFMRYTSLEGNDFLEATLCGEEPSALFDEFHVTLKRLCDELMVR